MISDRADAAFIACTGLLCAGAGRDMLAIDGRIAAAVLVAAALCAALAIDLALGAPGIRRFVDARWDRRERRLAASMRMDGVGRTDDRKGRRP